MFKDLIKSYKNTIEGMDLSIVYPYTETEIQPLYSNLWIEYINDLAVKFNDYSNTEKYLLNKSVIRSMLIMDIFDIYYSKKREYIENILNFYEKIINNVYLNDPFSIKNNIPNEEIVLKDYSYFKSKNTYEIEQLLGKCFSYSYKINHDIYADNTYEVKGLYKDRNFYYIVYDFFIKNNTIRIIQFENKISLYKAGTIDLFGHFTYQLEKNFVFELNKEIITDNFNYNSFMKNLFLISDTNENTKIINFKNRYKRYEKFFESAGIVVDINAIQKNIIQNKIKKRIVNVNKLLSILTYVLKEGNK